MPLLRQHSNGLKLCALVVLLAFLPAAMGGCMKERVRDQVEVRHVAVDWSKVDAPPLPMDGLRVRSILLKPRQFPLEASLKRILNGDFLAVADGFDLSYQSSNIPTGVLEDLYDEGFLPVYLRVENPTGSPLPFWPDRLRIGFQNGTSLLHAPADTLPVMLSELDEARTATAVLVGLLIVVVLLVSASEGKGGHLPDMAHLELPRTRAMGALPAHDTANSASPGTPRDTGLLHGMLLPPNSHAEGFVFFHMDGMLFDWPSAHLMVD